MTLKIKSYVQVNSQLLLEAIDVLQQIGSGAAEDDARRKEAARLSRVLKCYAYDAILAHAETLQKEAEDAHGLLAKFTQGLPSAIPSPDSSSTTIGVTV